jgi:hypothetical protein
MDACGVTMTKMDSQGVPRLDFPVEHFIDVHDKIYNLLNHCDGAHFTTEVENSLSARFKEGRQMIFFSKISRASTYTDMEYDYYVLPLPKYDEAQKEYVSTIHDSVTLFGVSFLAQKTDEIAAVLEVYASDALEYTTPALFDVTLKHRYSRDAESGRMLDLVKRTVVNDFACSYPGAMLLPAYNNPLCNIMRVYISTQDVSSKLVEDLPAWEALFNKLLEAFEKAAK